jgi:hypothetical protein
VVMSVSPFGRTGDWFGAELYYSGAWHDVAGDVDRSGITVSSGLKDEAGSPDAGETSLRLTNADGTYSPRLAGSALYGVLGRNTPMRTYLELGAPWLDVDGAVNSGCTCPDSAPVSITGDIDLRWEGYRTGWSTGRLSLITKWGAAGQRSWAFEVDDGIPVLDWSANGTAVLTATCTQVIPAWAGRIALRVTLDVNDGAGGNVVTFYTAGRLDGTWVQLGEAVTTTGTTSIFNSTTSPRIGECPDSSADSLAHRVYGWEIRTGIAGTVVSGVDTAEVTVGAASWSDGTRDWSIAGTGASITDRHILAVGEVSEWPMTWGLRGTPSVVTDVKAAGVRRRLGQGASPLASTLRRGVLGLAHPVIAYWPMEDDVGATSMAAASAGTRPATWVGTPTLGGYDGFACSTPIPTIGDAAIMARVPYYAATSKIAARFLVRFPASGMANGDVVAILYTAGALARVELEWLTAGGLRLMGYSSAGTLAYTGSTWGFGAVDVDWRISLELEQVGGNVEAGVWALSAGSDEGGGADTWVATTIGRATKVELNAGRTCATDMVVGHLTVEDVISSWTELWQEVNAWSQESAADRLVRLAAENAVSATVHGDQGATAALGAQGAATLLSLLDEAATADGGVLYDDPAALGFRYRTLRSMCDQPAVQIDYTDNLVTPFEPTDDDATTRNKVSVTRAGGGSFLSEVSTGPLGTTSIGIYDTAVEMSLGSDEQTSLAATWATHLGTWDEARYPVLGVDLAHPTFLADPVLTRDLLALEIGDRLVVNDPPEWLPPEAVDVIVVGRRLVVGPLNLRIEWVCRPARPWRVMHWTPEHRWCAPGTVTAEALDTVEVDVDITPPTDVAWAHADGDYDIMIGGERMTVLGVAGNTLTVARSVNGVVKAHALGVAVDMAEPSFWGR